MITPQHTYTVVGGSSDPIRVPEGGRTHAVAYLKENGVLFFIFYFNLILWRYCFAVII